MKKARQGRRAQRAGRQKDSTRTRESTAAGIIAAIARYKPTHVHDPRICAGCEQRNGPSSPPAMLGLYLDREAGRRVVYALCHDCAREVQTNGPAFTARVERYLDAEVQLDDSARLTESVQA